MSNDKNLKNELSRRELIGGAIAAGLTIGVAGCASQDTESAAPVAAAPGAATPGAAAQSGTTTIVGGGKLLAGTALPIQLPNGQPAVLVNPKSGALLAVSALCTHSGCTVVWKDAEQKLHCPCHGSVFDAAGKVQTGPATAPLATFKVQKKGDDAVLTL